MHLSLSAYYCYDSVIICRGVGGVKRSGCLGERTGGKSDRVVEHIVSLWLYM